MGIKVHKAKIASHLSYAFKTSMLEQVMEEVGAKCPAKLDFIEPGSTGELLKAQYTRNEETGPEGLLHVQNAAVAGELRKEITTLFEKKVLLEMMVWLEQAETLMDGSRLLQKPPTFNVTYVAGQMHLEHDFQ